MPKPAGSKTVAEMAALESIEGFLPQLARLARSADLRTLAHILDIAHLETTGALRLRREGRSSAAGEPPAEDQRAASR